ncbi:unnamed protein product [Rhizophagus irregularis]|nr:unnamed protein product [Rhizophagus irregularis]
MIFLSSGNLDILIGTCETWPEALTHGAGRIGGELSGPITLESPKELGTLTIDSTGAVASLVIISEVTLSSISNSCIKGCISISGAFILAFCSDKTGLLGIGCELVNDSDEGISEVPESNRLLIFQGFLITLVHNRHINS